jgi:hypothetical protein
MIATGRNRPGFEFCVSVARALGEPPEDILRRAGLLPALSPAVAEEREIIAILRNQSPTTRRMLLSMLRGLAHRGTSTTEPEPGGELRSSDRELLEAFRDLPEWLRPFAVDTLQLWARLPAVPSMHIIGAETEAERAEVASEE